MANATDCQQCGEPDAHLVREWTDPETGACCDLYLCHACVQALCDAEADAHY